MLLRDLVVAGQRVHGFGWLFGRVYTRYFDRQSAWQDAVRRLESDIGSVVPAGDRVILVDQEELGEGALGQWRTTPFLERDGCYWGLPPDDATAVRELERLRHAGARYAVFAWPSLWWLDHYADFNNYLLSKYKRLLTNGRAVIFDLREQ
jgi:hypothetical protein